MDEKIYKSKIASWNTDYLYSYVMPHRRDVPVSSVMFRVIMSANDVRARHKEFGHWSPRRKGGSD